MEMGRPCTVGELIGLWNSLHSKQSYRGTECAAAYELYPPFALTMMPAFTDLRCLVYDPPAFTDDFVIVSKLRMIHHSTLDDFDGNESVSGKECRLSTPIEPLFVLSRMEEIWLDPSSIPRASSYNRGYVHNSHFARAPVRFDLLVNNTEPLTMVEARSIAGTFIACMRDHRDELVNPDKFLTIWCHHPSETGSSMLMILKVNKKEDSLELVKLFTHNYADLPFGPDTEKDSLRLLRELHAVNQPCIVSSSAFYDILSTSCDNIRLDRGRRLPVVGVSCCWDTTDSLHTPSKNADAVVLLRLDYTEDTLINAKGFIEIKTLQELSCCSIETVDLIKRKAGRITMQLLQKIASTEWMEDTSLPTDSNSVLGVSTVISSLMQRFVRSDTDFTERLWVLFQLDSYTLDEWVSCVHLIIKMLVSGELCPYVDSNNKSRLGLLIMNCLRCSTMEKRAEYVDRFSKYLYSEDIITLLSEIGTFKVLNDYTSYFTKEELVTRETLNSFLAARKGRSIVECLKVLHCCFEMTGYLGEVLSVSKDDLRVVVKTMFVRYQGRELEALPLMFKMYLPHGSQSSSNLMANVRSRTPNDWGVYMFSTIHDCFTATTYRVRCMDDSDLDQSDKLGSSKIKYAVGVTRSSIIK